MPNSSLNNIPRTGLGLGINLIAGLLTSTIDVLGGAFKTCLYFEVGFIKVIGKGDKERLVPVGSSAVKHISL